MLFELNHLISKGYQLANQGIKSVLATVVFVDGSSYRPAGVRMLLSESGEQVGALSGGCVEQDVFRRAQQVFQSNQSVIMTYDGRYRLGCKGILYIVIEPFSISRENFEQFQQGILKRTPIKTKTSYSLTDGELGFWGTTINWDDNDIELSENQNKIPKTVLQFESVLDPIFQLHIFGAEHDARVLCRQAKFLGWQAFVYCSPKHQISSHEFQEAEQVIAIEPEQFDGLILDEYAASVIMTHNFSRDLRFLIQLIESNTMYIGILGSTTRREELLNELLEQKPVDSSFIDKIYSPAGLNIGAETPEEIALSITSEILSIQRQVKVDSLRELNGKIHV